MQYWGGPTTYSDTPRPPAAPDAARAVRRDPDAKDHWLRHFRAALDEVGLPPEQDAQFWEYVTHAAQFMVNTMLPGDRRALRADPRPRPLSGPSLCVSPWHLPFRREEHVLSL